jgi:hypothetical protein
MGALLPSLYILDFSFSLFMTWTQLWQSEGLKVNHFTIFLVDLAGIQSKSLSRKKCFIQYIA